MESSQEGPAPAQQSGGRWIWMFILPVPLLAFALGLWQPAWQRSEGAAQEGQASTLTSEWTDAPSQFSRALSQLPARSEAEWEVVSEFPRIFVRDDFLSFEECNFLKEQVAGRLQPAKVVEREENKYDQQVNVRNNQQIWLGYAEERDTPVISHILKRMHRAARIPDDDAEALQIGLYGIDEKYEVHPDSDPKNGVARPATLIVYLNDVDEGGETLFPLGSRAECTMRWRQDAEGKQKFGIQNCCDREGLLRISPKKGRAVLFFNHDTAGEIDMMAEHAACQVKRGEKWIAQRWFRYEPYQRLVHPPDVRFDGLPMSASQTRWTRSISQKSPSLFVIEEFLSVEECQALLDLLKETPSFKIFKEGGMARHWVDKEVQRRLEKIIKRMHTAVLMPEASSEPLQIGFYEPGSSQGIWMEMAAWVTTPKEQPSSQVAGAGSAWRNVADLVRSRSTRQSPSILECHTWCLLLVGVLCFSGPTQLLGLMTPQHFMAPVLRGQKGRRLLRSGSVQGSPSSSC
ncbi:unnamed protein product [Durusdinium trenchii]|uniref:Fe2OG dioxygenase domain-containing protein n=1 Tax=Durusdinium trenchii TaxID=1381693 RepID=A0ABP0RQY6_9DINO